MIPLREAPIQSGSKAYQLGRLLQAGEKVPDGFCLLAACSLESGLQAWRGHLQGQPVAVRSSSAREDGCVQSFAGQFTTILQVSDEASFGQAVEKVRASIQTGGVLVQPMLPARVAGVVFTLDPTVTRPAARVEATAGLGEALVSGRVRPSAWRIEGETIQLLDGTPCLSDAEINLLLAAARRAQSLLGGELDLEFAFTCEEEPWILQARPITAQAQSLEELCAQQRSLAQSLTEPGGTVWSRYSVAETLPHPQPMTWAIVQRMLSLRGAYGKLYRDLGYDPDPDLLQRGAVDLLCGRPYINLSREARFFFQDFPFAFPLAKLKADPRRASYPTPEVDLTRARPGFWRKLPATLWKMFRAQSRLNQLRNSFARQLRDDIAPRFLQKIEQLRAESLDDWTVPQLRKRLEAVLVLVVDDFAGDSLKASALAHLVAQGQAPRALTLDPETDLAHLMGQAAAGSLGWERLLECLGHRASGEMELAVPRWREVPELLREELTRVGQILPKKPTQPHKDDEWLRLRESSRHWLMHGWAEIRRTLLALDRALNLEGGIFWLAPEELDHPDPDLIAQRRRQHRLLQSIPCPAVLFSDDLEAIGRAGQAGGPGAGELLGSGLSWGIAEGPALVVERADQVPATARDYILVCPSTDPAFTAAMTRARGLVVETGGALSHGAIVARELGLPAVANISIDKIRTGQQLRVDGEKGTLSFPPQ